MTAALYCVECNHVVPDDQEGLLCDLCLEVYKFRKELEAELVAKVDAFREEKMRLAGRLMHSMEFFCHAEGPNPHFPRAGIPGSFDRNRVTCPDCLALMPLDEPKDRP